MGKLVMDKKRTLVLGYPIDLTTKEDALKRVTTVQDFMQIVTINPEMIEFAQKNQEFSQILKDADLIIPDGVGVKLALKFRKVNQEQIAGCDFAKDIIRNAALNGEKIALLGAKEDVLSLCAEKLSKEFPQLDIAYKRNGYFSNDDENQIIEEIKQSGAKYLFVALGSPKQEFFIKKCKDYGCKIRAIGVGGSFDVWSGLTQRAPEIWQKLGLEWLYRTIKQPQRFKRIFPTLPKFLFKVIITSSRECEK